MSRIRQQVDSKTKLHTKTLVRRYIVSTDADDRNVRVVEVLLACRERLALARAARRVVFRINIDHQPLALEVVERDGLVVLVLQSEIDEAFAFFYSHESLSPSYS